MRKINNKNLQKIKVGISFTPYTMFEWIEGLEKIYNDLNNDVCYKNHWMHSKDYYYNHDNNGYIPHYFHN